MYKLLKAFFLFVLLMSLSSCEQINSDEITSLEDIYSEASENQTYTIKAKAIAKNDDGFLLIDQNFSMFLETSLETFDIGDYIQLTATSIIAYDEVMLKDAKDVTIIIDSTYQELRSAVTLPERIASLDDTYQLGDYITYEGMLSLNEDTYTLNDYTLSYAKDMIDLQSYVDTDVVINGYLLYQEDLKVTILITDIFTVTQEIASIEDILQSEVGLPHFTEGVVVAVSSHGLLISDFYDMIFIQSNDTSTYLPGDEISVYGRTVTYGLSTAFDQDSIISKISHETYIEAQDPIYLTAEELADYQSSFEVGKYISFDGYLSQQDDQFIITFTTSDFQVILENESTSFEDYISKQVTLTGYLINLTGDTYQTATLIVTSIEENNVPDTLNFSIISVNDLHGYIEKDDYGMGGISNTAYLIDQLQSNVDDSILIANGDMFQGTAVSNMTEGRVVIDIMNMMNFDVMGIGNHEFDWGIDTILNYFDLDASNGEANFPLLNANIYQHDNDQLLSVVDGQVYASYIIEKDYVNVGVISYVGDIYQSIAYTEVQDYYFDLDIAASVERLGRNLKSDGADLIVVNIHGGNTSDIENYTYNQDIAAIKDSDGTYLVDVVINGHTHRNQTGMITRTGDTPLMLVQAGGNNSGVGVIDFEISTADMSITNYDVSIAYVSSVGTNFDQDIETYLQTVKSELGTVNLTIAGETVYNRSDLYDWITNVMVSATSADIAISNTGGVRSTGNIIDGDYVTLAQLYEIFPFDNTMWLIEATYDDISFLLDSSSLHYSLADGITLNQQDTYTVAVNSYVYYWDSLEDVRSENDIDTALYMRDLLVEDLEIKGLNNIDFEPISHPFASIGSKVAPTNTHIYIPTAYLVKEKGLSKRSDL